MGNLVLNRAGFKNFKNLSPECELQLSNLTILIGPNGSGKSNCIQPIKFLNRALSLGSKEEVRGSTGFDRAISEIGGERMLDAQKSPPEHVELKFDFCLEQKAPYQLELNLLIQDGHRPPIVDYEALSQQQSLQGGEPFYYYRCHNKQIGTGVISHYVSAQLKTRFHSLPDVPVNELALVSIPRLLERSDIIPENTPFYQVRRQIMEHVLNWQFYNANDMNLSAIRFAEPNLGPGDVILSRLGDNLPIVLDNLSQNIDFEEVLVREMKRILPWTRKIRSARSGRLKLLIEWYVQFSNGKTEQFYLSEMSDGSVRMLCWATVLLSHELPSLLVIEEPEIGIHPAWLQILADWIKRASQSTQVIVSTHSPDLLDCFTDRLDNVFVMEKSKQEFNRFYIRRLSPDMLMDKLAEGWQLGDLYRVGDFRVGGWPW